MSANFSRSISATSFTLMLVSFGSEADDDDDDDDISVAGPSLLLSRSIEVPSLAEGGERDRLPTAIVVVVTCVDLVDVAAGEITNAEHGDENAQSEIAAMAADRT
jgi:hypothetical protein